MDEMKELLVSWKVEVLNDKLEEYGYNIDSLECIGESDLKMIFPEKKFHGPVRRFEMFHSEWMKTRTTLPKSTISGPISETNEQNEESDLPESNQSFNLNVFVKNNETARALKARYDKVKNFTHEERLELVRVISDHLVAITYKMSIDVFEEISNQIALVFVFEKKDTYYCKLNGRNTGLLYVSYYNRLAAFTNKKKKDKQRLQTSPERTAQDPDGNSTDSVNDETKAAMEWMEKNNPIDEDDEDAEGCLVENWQYCFAYRVKTIETHKGNVMEILKIWPVLNNTYGYSLIEDDFEKVFGDKTSNFIRGWNAFAIKNINNLRKMIVDPIVNNILNNLSNGETEGTNAYDIEVVMALLHLMEPTGVTLKDKKRFRPTIPSSKSRLLKIVLDKALIDGHLALAKKDRQNKKLDLYPMIFGIGESNETVTEFVMRYNDICYTFSTFVDALDATFKFYIFFKIPFPPEHKRFWSLINGIFYKIETPLLDLTSTISSVILSFKI